MARARVTLDHAEVGRILKEDMRGPVHELAEAIAENLRDQLGQVGAFAGGTGLIDPPVTVRDYTTDRAATAVSIAHPAGLNIEAKHGSMRKAAASLGLEVKSKP